MVGEKKRLQKKCKKTLKKKRGKNYFEFVFNQCG